MIRFLILALAVLQVSDPVADAIGDGSLTPPTAPVYASAANFDLQEVVLTDDPTLKLRITMGALDNPGSLPLGFSNAVIEVYLDTAPGGAEALLPGSGMRMPSGAGWEYAVRLTGDEAYLVQAQDDGTPADWSVTALDVATDGTTLVIESPLPRPRHADLYALAGVYDAFGQQPWRAIAATPSPWAFSSPTQTSPVIDLLAPRQADQARALQTGSLPQSRKPSYGVGWLLLMLAGIVAAIVGLVFRRKVGLQQTRSAVTAPSPHATRPVTPAPVVGGAASGRSTSMWGDGTDLPLPRRAPSAAAAGSTSNGEVTERADPEPGEASFEDPHSIGVPASGPNGPWQDVLVPTYSVRPAAPGHGALDGSSGDDAVTSVEPARDADADHDPDASRDVNADHDLDVDHDLAVEAVADVVDVADAGDDGDAPAPKVSGELAVAPRDASIANGDGGMDPAVLASDSPEPEGSSRPFVPIVPLPAGPPLRRPSTGARATRADRAADHDHTNPTTSGDDTVSPIGWKPILVDPHDTFLEEPHEQDEAELWPKVRAVTGREKHSRTSEGSATVGSERERPDMSEGGTTGSEDDDAAG